MIPVELGTAIICIEIIDVKTVTGEQHGLSTARRAGNNNHSGAHQFRVKCLGGFSARRKSAAKVALCSGLHVRREFITKRISQ